MAYLFDVSSLFSALSLASSAVIFSTSKFELFDGIARCDVFTAKSDTPFILDVNLPSEFVENVDL